MAHNQKTNRRAVPTGCRNQVKVYKNLHQNCLSIQERGLVVGHADCVILEKVTFKISQSGRARCLKNNQKNVHAFVCGELIEASNNTQQSSDLENWILIKYNPYKSQFFYRAHDMEPIHEATKVIITVKGVYLFP